MKLDEVEEEARKQLSEREGLLLAEFKKRFLTLRPTPQQADEFHRAFLNDPVRDSLITQLVHLISIRPNQPILITPKTS